MNSTEAYEMLVRRHRRRFWIFRILKNVAVIWAVVALFMPGGGPWGVTAFVASVVFQIAWMEAAKKGPIAWRVAENPQLVYWAKSTGVPPLLRRGFMRWFTSEWEIVHLHLRDGEQFDVLLSPDKMRAIIGWLTERNPSIHIGNCYDGRTGGEEVFDAHLRGL